MIRESKDWLLVGICESDPGVRTSLEKAGVPFLLPDTLLSHSGISVIVVESPLRDHAIEGMAAAQSGKHLHLEKPPAYRLKDLGTILDAIRARGRLVHVGYMRRYHPGDRALEGDHPRNLRTFA